MRKKWEDEAWEEYLYWQSQDKKTLKKINSILKDIDRNGYNCSGHLETLKGNLLGYYRFILIKKIELFLELIM